VGKPTGLPRPLQCTTGEHLLAFLALLFQCMCGQSCLYLAHWTSLSNVSCVRVGDTFVLSRWLDVFVQCINCNASMNDFVHELFVGNLCPAVFSLHRGHFCPVFFKSLHLRTLLFVGCRLDIFFQQFFRCIGDVFVLSESIGHFCPVFSIVCSYKCLCLWAPHWTSWSSCFFTV